VAPAPRERRPRAVSGYCNSALVQTAAGSAFGRGALLGGLVAEVHRRSTAHR